MCMVCVHKASNSDRFAFWDWHVVWGFLVGVGVHLCPRVVFCCRVLRPVHEVGVHEEAPAVVLFKVTKDSLHKKKLAV